MKGFTHFVPSRAAVLTSFGESSGEGIPPRFSALVWNIYKAKRVTWATDFYWLTKDKDLVLLQEAFLRPAMREVIEKADHLRWDLAAGFTRKMAAIDAGVMTGSQAEPEQIFFLRSQAREPVVRVPKMVIGTTYPIQGSSQKLLVLNVHAINFVTMPNFRRQMRQLEEKIILHNGPVFLGGDFNTWLARRSHFLNNMTEDLGMELATFSPDRRSRHFGRCIDHVFVRGLKILSASCHYEIGSSDHQPLELGLEVLG
jgi:endonuclease/exonuclease/phosphatase (EEP) superfamily protein YafD